MQEMRVIVQFTILFLLLFQSTIKGDTVELLKKQLQEKDSQILEGKVKVYRICQCDGGPKLMNLKEML